MQRFRASNQFNKWKIIQPRKKDHLAFVRENEVSGLIYPMSIFPNGRIAMNKGQRGVPEHPLHVKDAPDYDEGQNNV